MGREMIHSELIAYTQLDAAFHKYAEQLGGPNPATIVQAGRKPKGRIAYPLAYYKAFSDPESDTGSVMTLRGMMSFTMLCAGPDFVVADITGFPHGLRCMLQEAAPKRGMAAVIMTGDGDEWGAAIESAGASKLQTVSDWGLGCYQQFQKNNLDDLFGTARKLGPGYFIE
jgi:hypothetical protein